MRDETVTKINVDGYKNLEDTQVELHDLSVIVGPNNSGKSNFLELFAFARGLVTGSDDYRKAIFERASTPSGHTVVCIKTEVLNGSVCKPITLSFGIEKRKGKSLLDIEYGFKIQCSTFWYDKKHKDEVKPELGFLDEKLTVKQHGKTGQPIILARREGGLMQLRTKAQNMTAPQKIDPYTSCLTAARTIYPGFEGLDPDMSAAISSVYNAIASRPIAPSAHVLREAIGSKKTLIDSADTITSFDFVAEIAKISGNESLYNELQNVLCQILDLESVFLYEFKPQEGEPESPDRYILFLTLPNKTLDEAEHFSDGTIRVIAIVTALLSPETQGTVIPIEELENCLHPKALKTLLSYLKQKASDKQIVITTHSTYVLNQIDPQNVIVAHDSDGGTRFEMISDLKELRKRLERGFISLGDLLEENFEDSGSRSQ
jgi:predicted ATPase